MRSQKSSLVDKKMFDKNYLLWLSTRLALVDFMVLGSGVTVHPEQPRLLCFFLLVVT